jgi:hypothetical protein
MQGQLFILKYWNQWKSGVFVFLSYVAASLFYREDVAASFLSIFRFRYIKWYQSGLYPNWWPACTMVATSLTSLVREWLFRESNWWSTNIRSSSWLHNRNKNYVKNYNRRYTNHEGAVIRLTGKHIQFQCWQVPWQQCKLCSKCL